MSVRPIHIAATLVLSFVASCAFLLWQRRGNESEAPVAVQIRMPVTTAPNTATEALPAPAEAPPLPPSPRSAFSVRQEVLPAVGLTPEMPFGPPVRALPVMVHFKTSPELGKLVGKIRNTSAESLRLEVDVINGRRDRREHTTLEVPANGSVAIGEYGDVELDAGAIVTLKRPPYLDLVVDVPPS